MYTPYSCECNDESRSCVLGDEEARGAGGRESRCWASSNAFLRGGEGPSCCSLKEEVGEAVGYHDFTENSTDTLTDLATSLQEERRPLESSPNPLSLRQLSLSRGRWNTDEEADRQ